jgi:uncharacterized protein (TIGR00299 family) protein
VRTLYLDCFSGIAGDMLVGALLDLGASFERVRDGLAGLGIGGYRLERHEVRRCGIRGVKFEVHLDEGAQTPHRRLGDIRAILDAASIEARPRARALAAFERLAASEARVHGSTADEVHFHEVGAVDALCDVVGAALALEDLGVEALHVGPIRVGSGFVRCAHGTMPVPAPGTLGCLEGFDVRFEEGRSELVTPTGACLVAALATPGAPGELVVRGVGYGAGTRDPEDVPNLLRAVLGDTPGEADAEPVWELRTNLDHLAPTLLQAALERVLAAGAVEAFVTPCTMKKGRPGHLFTALVPASRRAAVEACVFRETGTLGVRRHVVERSVLERAHEEVATPWGPVRVKTGRLEGVVTSAVPEFEDCRRTADEHGVPVQRVVEAARNAFSGHGTG